MWGLNVSKLCQSGMIVQVGCNQPMIVLKGYSGASLIHGLTHRDTE